MESQETANAGILSKTHLWRESTDAVSGRDLSGTMESLAISTVPFQENILHKMSGLFFPQDIVQTNYQKTVSN